MPELHAEAAFHGLCTHVWSGRPAAGQQRRPATTAQQGEEKVAVRYQQQLYIYIILYNYTYTLW